MRYGRFLLGVNFINIMRNFCATANIFAPNIYKTKT